MAEERRYDRTETMRRLGVKLVFCDICHSSMREPPDPFQGPRVLWGPPGENGDPDTLYYVCSSGCRDKMSAQLRAKRKPRSALRRGGAR